MTTPSHPAPHAAPTASRTRRPGWRDPRILIGILLVAGSVVLGSRVLASADDTTGVWAMRSDQPAGSEISAEAVVRREIRFADPADADRYLSADDSLPSGATLARAVGAGELLPRAALADSAVGPLVEVPVAADLDAVPATVERGSVVDVWVTPKTPATDQKLSRAQLVLDDVVVVSAPRPKPGLAPSGTRQVIVGVDPQHTDELARALGSTTSGHVVITRQGGTR